MTLVIGILLLALVFEYINGFHDTANSIATVVSTKVLTPRQAVALSATFNLLGALWGTAVATTIGKGLVDTQFVTLPVILSALLSAIVWGLLTWWFGLPSSSSHALIGGLCGATLAASKMTWSVVHWAVVNPVTGKTEGLWPKVILPMVLAPMAGILLGFLFMALLFLVLHRATPHRVNWFFGKVQLLSASWMSFSHGTNDAQKTMGVIALTLFTSTTSGLFATLPPWLDFLKTAEFTIPVWVKVACAVTMAAGTAAGGWRIIKTVGQKMVRLQTVHGFAAQTTAAGVIQLATHYGIPLSTTHVISSSIMGVGASKRFSAVKWGIVGNMLWAWVLTLPITGLMAYGFYRLLILFVR